MTAREEPEEAFRTDPYALNEDGKVLFEAGGYLEAAEVWKKALKEALKKSVRDTSMEWVELQTRIRLNIAQAYIKYEDYVMAKEHLLIIMDHFPTNQKAIYRLAQVYEGLADPEKALGIVRKGIELYPDEPSFKVLHNKIVEGMKNVKASKINVDLNALNDQRAVVDDSKPLVTIPAELDFTKSEWLAFWTSKLLKWKCDMPLPENDQPTRQEQQDHVDDDIDDWQDSQSKRWLTIYTGVRMRDDRTVAQHALPFSFLYAIDHLMRTFHPHTRVSPRELVVDMALRTTTPLPQLSFARFGEVSADFVTGLDADEMRYLAASLTKTGRNPMTVHVLNARGDDEMEMKWSAILERLPGLGVLQTVMVGFNDPADPYSRSITRDDYLSPQLAKRLGDNRKLVCRLYKGTYLQFLESAEVKRQTKTEHLQAPAGISPILTNILHPFHPDMVVIPQCNLSRRFDEYVPVIAKLALTDVPTLFLGHSACEVPSHEALQLPPVLAAMNVRVVSDMFWNPFMIAVKPEDENCPSMRLLVKKAGTETGSKALLERYDEIEYRGPSAKFAFGVWIKGFQYTEENEQLLRDLASDEVMLAKFKARLQNHGWDVSREADAIAQLHDNPEYQQIAADIVSTHQQAVEAKTAEIAEVLQRHLPPKPATPPKPTPA